jgi:hypothetical protein
MTLDEAWDRVLDLAWEAFAAGTTPVGAVVVDPATMGELRYAAADPYAGTGRLDFRTPQARRWPLRMAGPLAGERGRLAALLHLVWLLDWGASAHVVDAQRKGLPEIAALAEQVQVRRTLADAACIPIDDIPVHDLVCLAMALTQMEEHLRAGRDAQTGLWRMRDRFPRQFLASHVPYLVRAAASPARPVTISPADRSVSDITWPA